MSSRAAGRLSTRSTKEPTNVWVHSSRAGDMHRLNRLTEQSKEIGRSLDYLETRPDIDKQRIAYLGVSQGTADGVIFTALEERFRTVVFLDGGFFFRADLAGRKSGEFRIAFEKAGIDDQWPLRFHFFP